MTAMADCFLREVRRMHQLRRDINEMTPEGGAPMEGSVQYARAAWQNHPDILPFFVNAANHPLLA
jgi:hypothetical protein